MRRKWVSYSVSLDAVFCIPCWLLTDSASRGEQFRPSQGKAFAVNGCVNWKKHLTKVRAHEKSDSHQHHMNIENLIADQGQANETERLKKMQENRELVERIIDVILLLGKQGLAFRDHSESLAEDDVNHSNILELLKFIGKHDLKKVTFVSKNSQEKLIKIIADQIIEAIVTKIKSCLAWSLCVTSRVESTIKEQLSMCVCIVSSDGTTTEHIFACKRARGTTATAFFAVIIKAFESKDVSFEKLVAQTYDGASNMNCCYNGLQAIIKEEVGDHVIYVHCYAHSLNLVLKDTVAVETTTWSNCLIIWDPFTTCSTVP